ncbi:hypothetical protein A0U89_05615 [Kozakia baliensis]|uniref:Uncharacterized protein n=2 Tax=Kozakia baliensis TaxID=153496 RepID=A0A1D8USQ6_9PROT|nr:hypothetical protein A0U89_05615 [Kozakia baliensis]GEL64837.1 hypothetical protein KBA01_21230 [Kozakia baliensis]
MISAQILRRTHMIDPFFELAPDGEWNACVGSQGSEEAYVDGYIEAAITLVSAVVDNNHPESCDTLAMPILFNGRHALELSLKFVIARLGEIGAIADRPKTDHDIFAYWKHLHDASVGDKTIQSVIGALRPFVESLSAIDNDGQQLRYAKTLDGKVSLECIATIDLLLVKENLLVLRKTLARLRDRVEEYVHERGTETFTRECSRRDLLDMVDILGKHATWGDESFTERKNEARKRFCLSGRQLSKAIDKIRSSRELSARIGIEQNLAHLSDDKTATILQRWSEFSSSQRKNLKGDRFEWPDLNQVKEYHKKKQDLNEFILSSVTLDEFSDLCALYYLGRDLKFGEQYDTALQYTKARFDIETYGSHIDYVISKGNLLKHVIGGVERAGRPSLARKLREIMLEK